MLGVSRATLDIEDVTFPIPIGSPDVSGEVTLTQSDLQAAVAVTRSSGVAVFLTAGPGIVSYDGNPRSQTSLKLNGGVGVEIPVLTRLRVVGDFTYATYRPGSELERQHDFIASAGLALRVGDWTQ
jgi:hypothetical protein